MDMERNSLFTLQVKGEDKTREELQGGSENTEQRAETLGPGKLPGRRASGPVTRPHKPLKGQWGAGLFFIWSSSPCCVIKLRFCSKIISRVSSIHILRLVGLGEKGGGFVGRGGRPLEDLGSQELTGLLGRAPASASYGSDREGWS